MPDRPATTSLLELEDWLALTFREHERAQHHHYKAPSHVRARWRWHSGGV